MGNISSSLQWLAERNQQSSEKLCYVPGLQNLGNNCFLNVILQALASCVCFKEYLQKIREECESLVGDEHVELLPLIVALAALLEDLSTTRDGRVVLSPQIVMLAVHLYIPTFNLTCQQDAAEAFLHLLSSLREEFSESYVPNYGSLADISAFPSCRILDASRWDDQTEQKRWQQLYLGPFDGILGSVLTCQSCSFQIVMDFEFFHSLSLSPVLGIGGAILSRCTVEDCLKQYVGAEKIENYKCNCCWHFAAIKYLSAMNESETEIKKLKSCGGEESCDCRNLSCVKALPMANSFSRTFKQLIITRCPKILCIHLQRATMNEFGESVKLEGHISFPCTLNLSPFLKSGVEKEKFKENFQRGQVTELYQRPFSLPGHMNMHFNPKMLNRFYGLTGENIYSGTSTTKNLNCVDDNFVQAFDGGHEDSSRSAGSMDTICSESNEKACTTSHLVQSGTGIYHLVSVVEHFGRAGSGHYTVYRKMKVRSDNEHDGPIDTSGFYQWFLISDSEVHSVEEKDILAAEASLLFYERST